jgi:prepilin signal peptidase PulO-like enzyme (type II secretory pathway)
MSSFLAWPLAAMTGLAIGSFVGAVAYRLPRGISVVWPPSACPECTMRLRSRDLVPVVSFLATRGRCRHCSLRIPLRYPMTELATGGLFVAASLLSTDWLSFTVGAAFFSRLIFIFLIDLEHMLLPNAINVAGIALGLSAAALGWTSLSAQEALWGAALGYGVIYVVVLASRGGMGMGDAKFLALIGSFVGPQGVIVTLFGASLVGTVVGISLIRLGRHERRQPMPFGPYLAGGAVVVWILMHNQGLKSLVPSVIAGLGS